MTDVSEIEFYLDRLGKNLASLTDIEVALTRLTDQVSLLAEYAATIAERQGKETV